jgi:hypothetical protein
VLIINCYIHSFPKSNEFANCIKCVMCLFARSLLFTGQLSCFDMLFISFSLSVCSLVQS